MPAASKHYDDTATFLNSQTVPWSTWRQSRCPSHRPWSDAEGTRASDRSPATQAIYHSLPRSVATAASRGWSMLDAVDYHLRIGVTHDPGPADVLSREAMRVSTLASSERRGASVSDRQIAAGVVAGVIRNSLAERGSLRARLLRYLWIELKRFGASNVQNIPLSRIRGIHDVHVDGPVLRHGALVVSALAALLECETIFAFGAVLDETCAVIARNLPEVTIYALAPPEPAPITAVRPPAGPQRDGVTRLSGSATTFDLARYSGKNDLVIIDAGDVTGNVRAETDAAFSLLSELGTIVWDNYTHSANAYAYLNALAPALDRPVFHILGTRLTLYSRWDIVRPDD